MRSSKLPRFTGLPRFSIRSLTGWIVVALGLAGCSRQHYRERADKDVEGVITQKNLFPEWAVENWHTYPDPRARYADSSNPDFPAYPPDDYAAWVLSPNPQKPGHGGTGRYEGTGYLEMIREWDAQNRSTDPPATTTPPTGPVDSFVSAMTEDRTPYRLTLEQACELALLNSREFQDRREDLYLAALPVTLERFGFAAQAFAAEQVIREATGNQRPEGAGNRWRINTDAAVSRTFATGGQLLIRLANQIVVELGGDQPQIGLSNLSLTFLQPLLRGGGLAVTLEVLTQAERTLLYAIRSYARFRKVFYVAIAGTGDYTNNPYGLQGLSANLGRAVGNNFTAPRAGYLPTLLRAATLENEQENVIALGGTLKLFNNLKEGGVATQLQAVRVEQQLIRGRTTVLTNTRLYQEAVDNFKLQLGIPLTVPLELDDTPVRPIRKQLARFEELYAELREVQNAAGAFDPAETPVQYRAKWRTLLTESKLVRGTEFAKALPAKVAELAALNNEQLAKRISDLGADRQKLLDARAERQLAGKPDTPADEAALAANETATDFARFEQAFRQYETRPWVRLPADRQAGEQAAVFRAVFESGMIVAVSARNERMDKLRALWPALPGVVFDGEDVLRIPLDEAFAKVSQVALTNRLDLMNARAQVVDSWRQVAVRANALQGEFDVAYDLSTNTSPAEASLLGFSGGRARHQLILRTDLPIVRRAERNQYRAALIGYQRQRRLLMAFEDNVLTDTRQDLRQIRQTAETFKLTQRAVELAFAQVDNARATLLAPPDPRASESAGGPAALTEQLLNAQDGLVQAQNTLYTAWVNYLTARMELYLDLDLLPIDPRGVWIDDLSALPDPTPPLSHREIPPLTGDGSEKHLPGRRRRGWFRSLPVLLGGIVLLAGIAAGAVLIFGKSWLGNGPRPDLLTHKVKYEYLPVTVVERGQLESSENKDVICKVKAGAKGTFASTIKWVIDDGSMVNKGQLLMELDDSALQDSFKAQSIVVEKAKAEWEKAVEEYRIQVLTSESEIATAIAAVAVADLDLEKYIGVRFEPELNPFGAVIGAGATLVERGEFKQKLDDVSGRLKQAQSDQEAYRDRAGWAGRSVRLGYLTASQAKVEQSKYESSLDNVGKLEKEKYILEEFMRKRDLTDLSSKSDVARMGLDKARQQAKARESQAESTRRTANSVFQQELDKLREIEDQIRECKITSPQDGMVVYFVPESGRFGQTQQGMISQGEQVKEGQKLMRIPDLRRMQVNTKVHEAMVGRIRGDDRQSTGVVEATLAAMFASPDLFSRLLVQSDYAIDRVRELLRDYEYRIATPGQPCSVRVDAKPGRILKGHVRTVASVASKTDFMSSEVKVFQTLVLIDETVDGLKPDYSAEVTIHVDATKEAVLAVPQQAVVVRTDGGTKRSVFVVTPAGPVEKDVELGMYNDKMIEVLSGLAEGDEVVINPKVLVGDKAKTREESAGGRGGREGGPGGEGKGKGGGKGRGGPGGMGGRGMGPGGPQG